MIQGTVLNMISGACIELVEDVNWVFHGVKDALKRMDSKYGESRHCARRAYHLYGRLTMRLRLAGSITASVADNNDWYCWVDFDVDERMLPVCIVFGNEESRRVQLFCGKGAAWHD